VIDAARAVSVPNDREIIHVVPRGYIVDGQEGVRDAVGMSGARLEVETHIIHRSLTAVAERRQVRSSGGHEPSRIS